MESSRLRSLARIYLPFTVAAIVGGILSSKGIQFIAMTFVLIFPFGFIVPGLFFALATNLAMDTSKLMHPRARTRIVFGAIMTAAWAAAATPVIFGDFPGPDGPHMSGMIGGSIVPLGFLYLAERRIALMSLQTYVHMAIGAVLGFVLAFSFATDASLDPGVLFGRTDFGFIVWQLGMMLYGASILIRRSRIGVMPSSGAEGTITDTDRIGTRWAHVITNLTVALAIIFIGLVMYWSFFIANYGF